MLTIRRCLAEKDIPRTPIHAECLIGEETLLRVSRSGFSLAYAPLERAEWRIFPPKAAYTPSALCADRQAALFLAYEDDCYVGCASLRPYDEWMQLEDIRVDVLYRRHGIATALLETAEQFALHQGAWGIRVEVSDQHPILCRFLEKRGYTIGGMDRLALAMTPEERQKPMMRRACALFFYHVLKKGC